MIGLDTNVLLRYFAQDDEKQTPLAEEAIEALTEDEPGFVSLVVLAEVVWMLGRSYALSNDEILVIVAGMLSSREFRLQRADVVARALRLSRGSPAGFADALIGSLGADAGCETTLTFDKSAAANLDSMSLVGG